LTKRAWTAIWNLSARWFTTRCSAYNPMIQHCSMKSSAACLCCTPKEAHRPLKKLSASWNTQASRILLLK